MTHAADTSPADLVAPKAIEAADARDLQSRLYREIGISAVAAALRFTNQPDPDKVAHAPARDRPAILRDEHLAA